ncbi:NACHT domain-containing protein [Amycolatopsis silviterrae]|uniref:NACHT domain-containing protein n=1 Tax=Amycolatopsis silviterrae TaxID=1656914 RepID=A0ABW5H3X4_9PSEU
MSGIEVAAQQALQKVVPRLFSAALGQRKRRRTRAQARPLTAGQVADQLLEDLSDDERLRLDEYLRSPDFEEIALQLVLGLKLSDVRWERLSVDIRDELRLGLRRAARIRTELLTSCADVVFEALVVAGKDAIQSVGPAIDPNTLAVAGRLSAAAAANSRLLQKVESLAEFHRFAEQLRAQVVALHSEIRLPHLGISRSVPYEQLYTEPSLCSEKDGQPVPKLDQLAHPCRRTVILGDPGAGKSTLAAKLACDVAADRFPGAEGRVPFLIVLRSFAGSFRRGGAQLVRYLEKACQDPYNLQPPAHAVDYLLRNGRAVVVLDGLDELAEPELRRRVGQLVEGFVNRYPLVPVLVTARKIGYAEAPLSLNLFQVGVVTELADDEVAAYAEKWFALDPALSAAEQRQLAQSFTSESEYVKELCRNSLILALICAMYSSDRYIPRNLAQVYERCATMLFERWDSMRGIGVPTQFQGRLRGAIQHLAWKQFVSAPADGALTRRRIVRILSDYLVTKHFDEDDAAQTAEEFIQFCTGRAWVLTDVGATETEPRYGFTHRTFLEYFAAEHLVRQHADISGLWAELLPRISMGDWEVVGQIAIQLFDRNAEDGADTFVAFALSKMPDHPEHGSHVRSFLARTLGFCQPGHHTVRAITKEALAACLNTTMADRLRYGMHPAIYDGLRTVDNALLAVMYDSLPANLPVIRRTIVETLGAAIDRGDAIAFFIACNISRHFTNADKHRVDTWADVYRELTEPHAEALQSWRNRCGWYIDGRAKTIQDAIALHGPQVLYLRDYFLTGSVFSFMQSRLVRIKSWDVDRKDTEMICEHIVAASLPWFSSASWWRDHAEDDQPYLWLRDFGLRTEAEGSALRWLLMLPYLEMTTDHGTPDLVPAVDEMCRTLIEGRRDGSASSTEAMTAVRRADMPAPVRLFLRDWMRREISVLPPPA